MARSDYEHWNEEQDIVWWQEEGKHEGHQELADSDPEDFDRGDYDEDCDE